MTGNLQNNSCHVIIRNLEYLFHFGGYRYLYNFRMVIMDVPVMAFICRSESPFLNREISFAYCAFILSSDLRYETGRPILIPSLRHLAMYCFRPLAIRSAIVWRSIWAISSKMVQINEATGLILPLLMVSRL